MEEGDADWERAHLIGWEWCGGGRCRLGEGALDSWSGVGEKDTDWERAHLIGWKGMIEGGSHRLGESALDRVGMVWRKTPTGRERT